MSHNVAALVPYITSYTTALGTAGAGQTLTITGFGLSLATTVTIPAALGVETARTFTKTGATEGVLTITLTVESFTEGTFANRSIPISQGGVPAQGPYVTSGMITVNHGWSPLLDNPTLWLDGNDENSFDKAGGRISKWCDKSGNGNDFTQATAARQPTYVPDTAGGGYGAFSSKGGAVSTGDVGGTPTYLESAAFVAGNASGHITMFFVVSKRAVGAGSLHGDYIVRGPHSNVSLRLRYFEHSGGYVNNRFGSIFSTHARLDGTSEVSLGSKYIVTVTGKGTGTADTLRVNGVEEDSNDIGAMLGGARIWQVGTWVSAYLAEAEIAEIIFYDSILSDADRDIVEAYLNNKWGAY